MSQYTVKRVQLLSNKLAAMERRRLKRRGEWQPASDLSYEEYIAAGRAFAARVLRRWRLERPNTLRHLVRSDAI